MGETIAKRKKVVARTLKPQVMWGCWLTWKDKALSPRWATVAAAWQKTNDGDALIVHAFVTKKSDIMPLVQRWQKACPSHGLRSATAKKVVLPAPERGKQ